MRHIKASQLQLSELESMPLAIIVSQFNREITKALQKGALEQLASYGIDEQYLTLVEVPGAVEIPIVAQCLAEKNKFGAIIVLGAVIRGDTTHYDYVCEQVSQGCQQVALKYHVPVIFGVLTTENEAQAWERTGGQQGHKGKDAIDCALAMCSILKQL